MPTDDRTSSASSSSSQASALLAKLRGLFRPARTNLRTLPHEGLSATGFERGVPPRVDRLGGMLPFDAVTPDGLLVTTGKTRGKFEGIAFAVEIIPQTGVTDDIQKSLKVIPSMFPIGSTLAFTVFASPVVDRQVDDWVRARTPVGASGGADGAGGVSSDASGTTDAEALVRAMAARRGKLIREAARRQILPNAPVHARDFRAWFVAVVPQPHPERPGAMASVRQIRENVRAVLRQHALEGWVWGPQDWLDTWRQLLNPQALLGGMLGPRAFNPLEPPRDQIMNPETMVTVGVGGMRFASAAPYGVNGVTGVSGSEGSSVPPAVTVAGLSAFHYPRHLDLGTFSLLLGDPGRSGAQIPCPFLLTTLFQIADPATEKMLVETHKLRAQQMAPTPIGTMVPYYREFHASLQIAANAFATEGGVGPVTHQMILFAPDAAEVPDGTKGEAGAGAAAAAQMKPQLETALQAAKALSRQSGFDLMPDQAMHAQALLACLPGAAGPLWAQDARAVQRFPKRTIATAMHGLPLMTEWKGTGPRAKGEARKPLLMLLGRKGQVFGVDPFANPEGSYSMTVVGKPGSGKSVVLNDLAAGVWASGGLVRIIDVGRSYEKLCAILGGDFVTFSTTDVWDLNPFNLLTDAAAALDQATSAEWYERLDMVVEIFSAFMCGGRPKDFQASILAECVTTVAYRAAGERRVGTVAELRDELLNYRLQAKEDRRAAELAAMLSPYLPGGPYEAWFNGTGKPMRFKNRLTVLEMEHLEGQAKLKAGALMTLILTIEREMAAHPRDETKLVLIDEAWDLMSAGNAGSFIEKGYRRARKHRGAFVTATQSIADYRQSPTAEAAWRCADTRIFLRQDKDAVDAMIASGHFSPTPWLREAITSVTTIAGAWSEMVVQVGGQPPAIGRLVLDPVSRVTYSTLPAEFEAVQRRVAAGMSWAGAILDVARLEEIGAFDPGTDAQRLAERLEERIRKAKAGVAPGALS